MKKFLILLILIAPFSFAPSAHACSVIADSLPETPSEAAEGADAVFVGEVMGIIQDRSVNGEFRITFEVEEAYKGSLGDTVTVRIQSSSAACGYDDGYDTFEKGSVWAMYLHGDASEGYTSNSLSLNTEYKTLSAANKALQADGLEPVDEDAPVMCTMIYAPVCGMAPDGTVKTYGSACVMNAEKGTLISQGECKPAGAVPAQDLTVGSRGTDVTWLQEYLISKMMGMASASLKAVGPTGYFGELTRAALAEFQAARNILPSVGYFGAKTRAVISGESVPAQTAKFTGEISAVDTGCFVDGVCSVTVDGKEIILVTGMRFDIPPVGTLQGVDSIGDLEQEIGNQAEVYAAVTEQSGADYTLYGNTAYYVKVL